MPRPRFNKLSDKKRLRILEAAAKEFSANGFENASLNKILDQAGISKGAAYYYFDDKADLYTTTLLHYMQELLSDLAFDPNQLTAKNFWSQVADLYRLQFSHYYKRPWVFGVAKSSGSLPLEALQSGPMAVMWESAQGLLNQLVTRGRELGAIRADLPDELALSLLVAVDSAHDRWLYDRWDVMTPAEIDRSADRIADILRRLLGVE